MNLPILISEFIGGLIVLFCSLFVMCTLVVAWQLEQQRIQTSESRFVSQIGTFIGGFILGMWFVLTIAWYVYK